MNRTRRRSSRTALCVRLTLAAFAATLPEPAAWAQAVARVAPITVSSLSSAAGVSASATPTLVPSFQVSAMAAAPLAAAVGTAPGSPLVAPSRAPGAVQVLREISDGIASFDGSNALVKGPLDGTYQSVPGSEGVVRGKDGRLYRLGIDKTGLPSEAPLEKSGLTVELVKKMIGALQLIDQEFVDKLSPEKWNELIDKGLAAITEGLKEPHTQYFNKDSWSKFLQEDDGNYTGIGFDMDLSREEKAFDKALAESNAKGGAEKIPLLVHKDGLRVRRPRKGSPAEAAGFKPGDVIVRVDGAKIGGQPVDDALKKIQGQAGTEVKLAVSRGGKDVELTATRAVLEIPLLNARMVAPGVGYIHYSEFRPESDKDFIDALSGLVAKGAKKVIIDLRGNGGGDIDTANNIMASLLPGGLETATTRHRGVIDSRYKTKSDGPFAGMEKIVLVDGHSASASEMTAATLQDYGVAVVGPSKSYGKFSFQEVHALPLSASPQEQDSGIKITGGRFYSGKGRSFPGRFDPRTDINVPGSGGVTPDVIVPMTKAQERDVNAAIQDSLEGAKPRPVADPVLDKAIRMLRGPSSSN